MEGNQHKLPRLSGGGVVIVCRKATFNTNEAKGGNPKANSSTLTVHPTYTECRSHEGAGSFPVEARTTGCDYKLHAVAPGKPEGSLDIECETGKRIEYVFMGLTGCVVTVFPQTGLKSLEYKNEPKGGTGTQEVTTSLELSKIKSKAAAACGLGIGEAEFAAEYRQGKIPTIGGIEEPEIEPAGHPATVVFKGFAEATKAQEALEVVGGEAPTVTTGEASGITQSSALLNGTVNPDGKTVTDCHFEYGLSTSYGSSAPCSPSPGSGETAIPVSAAVTGLSPSTTYHFRISATNSAGTITSTDATFKTRAPTPTVVTEAASSVTQTTATLNGTVNPNGFEVSECRLDYGLTEGYGSSAPCSPSPGSGTSPVSVAAALESLSENTTYHFRVVAANANGTSFGADQTFTTRLVLGPHWYQNHVLLGENGIGFPVLLWGFFTLENTKLGALTCQIVAGGNVANPSGGGAGKGSIVGSAVYECVAPTCEAAKGEARMIPEKLNWSSVLLEEAGVFRNKLEGIALRATCAATASNVEFHGSLKPSLENGTGVGYAPSRLIFGTGSGSLTSTEGPGAVTAQLKLMGFEGEEIVSAKKT